MSNLILMMLSSLLAQFPACRSSNSSRHTGRDPRVSSSTARVATHPKEKAAHSPPSRSMAVDLAFATMVRLAFCFDHGETGDGRRLAPSRFSMVSDLELVFFAARTLSSQKEIACRQRRV